MQLHLEVPIFTPVTLH